MAETDPASPPKIRIVSSTFLTGAGENNPETLQSVMPSPTAISLRNVAGKQNVTAPRKAAASRIVTQNIAVPPYITVAADPTASGSVAASCNILPASGDVTRSSSGARAISVNPGQAQEVMAPTRLEGGQVVRRIIRLSSRDDVIADLQNELEALKKSLSQQQLSNHKLEFEKKLLKKERDEFEQLLTDSEAAAKRLKADLRTVLSEDFSSVDDLKARAADILNETDSDPDEVLINEELIKFSDPYTLTDYLD